MKTVWRRLLDVERAVIERVEFDAEAEAIVAAVRPRRGQRNRCGRCGRKVPRYDAGEGRRRWRALDLGTVPMYIEADAPRVVCAEHGVVVAAVPWARHDARHTRAFDDQAAWLATHCAKSAVGELLRVTKPSRCSRAGSPGPGARASRPSSRSRDRSPLSVRASPPRSPTDCPMPWSSQ